ncbi:MAG TPA: hypothetical protein GX395_01395 [Clostridia bacterium]|nr:hypothetical protein [Clostridia bacterium]
MKRHFFKLALILIMVLALVGCGSKEKTGQEKGEVESVEAPQTVASGEAASGQNDSGKGLVCTSYEAYNTAWYDFADYVIDASEDHEIVAVKRPLVLPMSLKSLNYIIPLSTLGQSINTMGQEDLEFEKRMLQAGWMDEVELTKIPEEGYLVIGTDKNGNQVELEVRYDAAADSLRLKAVENGKQAYLLEYTKTPDGYVAQQHYVDVVEYEKGNAVEGLCTYRMIFGGTKGSCARFKNVSGEPESIFGKNPEAQSFIEGATDWLTVTDGQFTGLLGGQSF